VVRESGCGLARGNEADTPPLETIRAAGGWRRAIIAASGQVPRCAGPKERGRMTTATKTDGAGARRKSTGNAADARRYEPHGYLIGSQQRPNQITIYAITGGPDRWLRFRLDSSRPPGSFVA